MKTRVAGLIRDLDADQRVTRIHAERDLLDLGPAILSELPSPELIAKPAVRASVAKVRKALELRKAAESVLPSKVTTKAGISFADFVHEVEQQTGNRIDITRLGPAQLKSDLSNDYHEVPFWKALETALPQAGARIDFKRDLASLSLQPRDVGAANTELAISESGAFRVALESVKSRDIAGTTQKRLRAEFSLTPEPRLRALFLKFAAKDFSAVSQSGRVLLPADPDAQLDLPLGEGGHHVRWTLDFLVPKDLPLEELKQPRISGKATMQVAAGSEHIRIRDLATAQGVSRRRGGVTVSVLKVKVREIAEMKRDISVQIQVAYDTGGPAFESHRTWIFHNQVYLHPLDGEPIPVNGGYETDLQGNGIVGVTYRFNGIKQPLDQLQFVYVAPTLIIDVPIGIELQTGQIPGM